MSEPRASVAMPHTRVAIVGTGYWGINLVRTFAQDRRARVTWICDRDREALDRASMQAPGARLSRSFDEVLDADDVDAVVIATPAVTHADMACRALAADKHVYVEKPLALDVAGTERVRVAAQGSRRLLMAGHLMVYHPAVEYLRTLIDSGELGEILYLYCTRVNLGRVRRDENALWSFAPHDISMIDYLLGAMPVSVWATGESYLAPGVEDVVFVNLKFDSRQMAHIHLSWLDPRKERRLTIVGSKKMAVFDDVSSEKLRIYDKGYDRPPQFTDFGEYLAIRSGGVYIPHIKMVEPLARECGHFLHCIESGETPTTGINSATRVVRVLAAAQRSLDQGQRVTVD
ncbi:MAG: Gfo/Idh/MocA family oxidoreductase [Proteobacteria bacterium]|nr:Gfo/Idh/MocA family oxidoreductase [Pseudomonadota bacterium]